MADKQPIGTALSIERFCEKYLPFDANAIAIEEDKKEQTTFTDLLLKKYPQLIKDVQKYLGSLGITRLAFFSRGTTAMIFDTVHDQMVRISYAAAEEPRLPNLPQILQPLMSTTLCDGKIRIEILPRVRTAPEVEITEKHIHALVKSLEDAGYLFYDCNKENIGLLSDGTPVILDPGAVVPLKMAEPNNIVYYSMPDIADEPKPLLLYWSYWGQFAKKIGAYSTPPHIFFDENDERQVSAIKACLADAKREGLKKIETISKDTYSEYEWEASQQKHRDDFELKIGELRGVISPDDVKKFIDKRDDRRGDVYRYVAQNPFSTYEKLVTSSGHYKPVYREVIREAARHFPKANNDSAAVPFPQRATSLEKYGGKYLPHPEENLPPQHTQANDAMMHLLALFDNPPGFCHYIDAARRALLESKER